MRAYCGLPSWHAVRNMNRAARRDGPATTTTQEAVMHDMDRTQTELWELDGHEMEGEWTGEEEYGYG